MLQLRINMDEFAFVLHRGPNLPMDCYLDLKTGEILNIPTDRNVLQEMLDLDERIHLYPVESLVEQILPNKTKFKHIPDLLPDIIFDLMNQFTSRLKKMNAGLADRLQNILHGEGGSHEFYRLIRKNRSINKKFIDFRDNYFLENAEKWLRDNGIKPLSAQKSRHN